MFSISGLPSVSIPFGDFLPMDFARGNLTFVAF